MGTTVIELGARRAARTDGADDLIAELDDNAAAEKHDVRKLGEWRDRIFAFSALGQRKRVVFERHGSVSFVMSAIERVNAGAGAAQARNDRTVVVEYDRGFGVALSGASRDGFACRFGRKRRRNSICRQSVGKVDAPTNEAIATSNVLHVHFMPVLQGTVRTRCRPSVSEPTLARTFQRFQPMANGSGSSNCAISHRGARPDPLLLVAVEGAVYTFGSWLGDEGAVVRVLDRRRFPPPWTVDEQRLCFVVRDQNGQAVARLYFEEDSSPQSAGKLLPRDRAQWIAARIMRLPELLHHS